MSLAIAVDLGGTQIRAAVVTETGEVLARSSDSSKPTAEPDEVIQQLADAALAVAATVADQSIAGVGVCLPGPLDTVAGISINLNTFNRFANIPLLNELRQRLPWPVTLENDAIAAAVGEWTFGAGRGHSSVVYMTVSTGVGGGVIIDGHVLRGRKGMAGHIGHMAIRSDGPICFCGAVGCLEAAASGTHFALRGRERARLEPSSQLHGRHGDLDAQQIFEAAAMGDALAIDLVEEEAAFIGFGVTNLLHLYSPDVVVIGGGVSNGFDQLSPGICRTIAARAMPAFRDTPVVRATLGGNSGLIGMATLVRQKIEG